MHHLAKAVLIPCLLSATVAAQASWAQLYPAVAPPARADAVMGFHAATAKFVLFSGSESIGGGWGYRTDCWTLSGSTWTQVTGAVPSARINACVTYDTARQRLVMFGGYNQSARNDTWEWNGTAWIQRTSAVTPPARSRAAMAHDEVRGVTVMFGGEGSTGNFLDDVWEWNGTAWANRTPPSGPGGWIGGSMAFDPARGDVMAFGGGRNVGGSVVPSNETWSWSGTTWTQQLPATPPAIRNVHRLATDLHRQRVVLYGGDNNDPFAWEWDGQQWSIRLQATPGARWGHGFAYDSVGRRTVAFGGYASGYRVADTWVFATPTPATVVPSGAGCAGAGGVPVLASAPFSLPWLGDTSRTRLTNLAPASLGAFFVTATAATAPVALAAIGMPGCDLLVQLDMVEFRAATGSFVDWQLELPNVPALVSARLYQQGFAVDTAANPLGLSASQRIEIVPGIR